MSKIDELITAAEKAVNESSEEDKPSSEQYLKALKDAKAANVGLSQEEVNKIVKDETEKATKGWKDALGMDLSEAQEILGDMNDEELASLLPDGGSESEGAQGEEGEQPVSERIKSALSERDQKITASDERITELSRSLNAERVENRLKETLREKGLKDGRFDLARRLAGEQDLVEKMMKGEEVKAEDFEQAAVSLQEASPEWFGGSAESDPRDLGNGVRLREDALVGVAPTPTPREAPQMTDEQRASRATSPYR